mmetsp:Transcript_19928/g.61875  ORF Transcript_19928/g.61875 Transcript_19928/m.61875 type:complete len:395 (-) Transcript_19928:2108-3292(-)
MGWVCKKGRNGNSPRHRHHQVESKERKTRSTQTNGHGDDSLSTEVTQLPGTRPGPVRSTATLRGQRYPETSSFRRRRGTVRRPVEDQVDHGGRQTTRRCGGSLSVGVGCSGAVGRRFLGRPRGVGPVRRHALEQAVVATGRLRHGGSGGIRSLQEPHSSAVARLRCHRVRDRATRRAVRRVPRRVHTRELRPTLGPLGRGGGRAGVEGRQGAQLLLSGLRRRDLRLQDQRHVGRAGRRGVSRALRRGGAGARSEHQDTVSGGHPGRSDVRRRRRRPAQRRRGRTWHLVVVDRHRSAAGIRLGREFAVGIGVREDWQIVRCRRGDVGVAAGRPELRERARGECPGIRGRFRSPRRRYAASAERRRFQRSHGANARRGAGASVAGDGRLRRQGSKR